MKKCDWMKEWEAGMDATITVGRERLP